MTKEDFEKMYCEGSEITIEFYHQHLITVACDCEEPECEGWAAYSKGVKIRDVQ